MKAVCFSGALAALIGVAVAASCQRPPPPIEGPPVTWGQQPSSAAATGATADVPGSAGPAVLPAGHPDISKLQPAVAVDVGHIQRADGGQTVAEIYAGKAALAGKTVTLRGRVVKVNSRIMGRNWLHLRDGTGSEGRNDLTVTTQAMARAGDTVLVRGTLVADRDFGSGFRYEVLVEGATVEVE
ncbi:MAG: hypothetical protein JXR83_06725 [Deltaproteobacteria bacterium]|nr:hypothetical protein [Deltaproteobacteria bacterium]